MCTYCTYSVCVCTHVVYPGYTTVTNYCCYTDVLLCFYTQTHDECTHTYMSRCMYELFSANFYINNV